MAIKSNCRLGNYYEEVVMKRVFLFVGLALSLCLMVASITLAGELDANLRSAIDKGDTTVVRSLLAKGANVDATDERGSTPLLLASSLGRADIVHLLLAKGADINMNSNNGETALMKAARMGLADLVKLFLDKGASIDAKSTLGVTALWWATVNGHAECVRILINKGADVNSTNSGTTTILGEANDRITKGKMAGFDKNPPYAIQYESLTPVEKKNYEEIVKMLKAAGAN
jgi:ankyrin repeat protein